MTTITDAQILRCGIVLTDKPCILLPEDFWFADISVGKHTIRIEGLTDLELLRRHDECSYEALMHAMFRTYMRMQKHVRVAC